MSDFTFNNGNLYKNGELYLEDVAHPREIAFPFYISENEEIIILVISYQNKDSYDKVMVIDNGVPVKTVNSDYLCEHGITNPTFKVETEDVLFLGIHYMHGSRLLVYNKWTKMFSVLNAPVQSDSGWYTASYESAIIKKNSIIFTISNRSVNYGDTSYYLIEESLATYTQLANLEERKQYWSILPVYALEITNEKVLCLTKEKNFPTENITCAYSECRVKEGLYVHFLSISENESVFTINNKKYKSKLYNDARGFILKEIE